MKKMYFFIVTICFAVVVLFAQNERVKIDTRDFKMVNTNNILEHEKLINNILHIEIESILFPRNININDLNKCSACFGSKAVSMNLISPNNGSFCPTDNNLLVLIYSAYIKFIDNSQTQVLLITEYNIKENKSRIVDSLKTDIFPEGQYALTILWGKGGLYSISLLDITSKAIRTIQTYKIMDGKSENTIKENEINEDLSIRNFEFDRKTRTKSEILNNERVIYKITNNNGIENKEEVMNWGTRHQWMGDDKHILFYYEENDDQVNKLDSYQKVNEVFYDLKTKLYKKIIVSKSIKIKDKKMIYQRFLSINTYKDKLLFIGLSRISSFGIFELKEPLY